MLGISQWKVQFPSRRRIDYKCVMMTKDPVYLRKSGPRPYIVDSSSVNVEGKSLAGCALNHVGYSACVPLDIANSLALGCPLVSRFLRPGKNAERTTATETSQPRLVFRQAFRPLGRAERE